MHISAALRVPTLALLAALIWKSPTLAITNLWTAIGPDGGEVRAIAIDPTNPSTLYAGTVYAGMFASVDAGAHWSPTSGLSGRSIEEIIVDHQNPAILYARGDHWPEGIALYKSVDGGGTWRVLTIAGGFRGGTMSLAIDPTNSQILYAGLGGAGVYKSTDGGNTWRQANAAFPDPYIAKLAIDPNNPATLYAGTLYGVFKSTDAAEHWAPINDGVPDPTGEIDVRSLAIDPTTPDTLYLGTSTGFFRSTNAGGAWAAVDADLPKPPIVDSIVFDPHSPGTVYVIGPGNCPGYFCSGTAFKSTDGGRSWTSVLIGLPLDLVRSIAVGPNETLYVGMTVGGVLKSSDGGATWTSSTRGLTATSVYSLLTVAGPPTTLYAGTSGGLLTTAGGDSWSPVRLGGDAIAGLVAAAASDPETIYAVDGADVFKSTDRGVNWVATGSAPAAPGVLVVDPTSMANLYAATANGVFKSTDSGANWIAASSGLPPPTGGWCGGSAVNGLTIDPTAPSTLYASVFCTAFDIPSFSELFKTTDGGANWILLGLSGHGFTIPVVIDPLVPGTLYAAPGGLFKSTNGGITWSSLSTGVLASVSVSALALDPVVPTTIYAGADTGVFKSSDGGGNWKAVSDLTTRAGPLPSVTALSVDPAAPSTLYAGLAHGGVFAIQQAAVCVGDCGGTQTVAITDLITLVNIALGTAELAACPNGLPGDVDITTILQAVNNALNGCPS